MFLLLGGDEGERHTPELWLDRGRYLIQFRGVVNILPMPELCRRGSRFSRSEIENWEAYTEKGRVLTTDTDRLWRWLVFVFVFVAT